MGVGDDLFLDFPDSESLTWSGGERGRKRKYSFPSCEAIMDEGCGDVNFEDLSKEIKLEAEDSSDLESNLAPSFMPEDAPELDELIENGAPSQSDDDGIIMLHMDIREPLIFLKDQLENRLRINLDNCVYTLQDSQTLEGHMNLVDQCVQGEGLVQVNVELKVDGDFRRINIVDVLKPAEEYVEIGSGSGGDEEEMTESPPPSGPVIRWVMDVHFKAIQEKNNIPKDPLEWTNDHVRHWLLWAYRQFDLNGINFSDWTINGKQLCSMDYASFKDKVPKDPDSIFWTHFELLRKCKIVAVSVHALDGITKNDPEIDEVTLKDAKMKSREKVFRMTKVPKVFYMDVQDSDYVSNNVNGSKNSSASNSQVQLWQFLLELLTDKDHRNAIQWLETEGEFKLINPELVAHLWGERKNKPAMNYEKLSRALRYYYYGNMISKVPGKRFVYKFVCDLKLLIGYSANELNALVLEAELNAKKKNKSPSYPSTIYPHDYLQAIP